MTTELVTFSRPAMVSTLAEVGLVLAETKALLAKLQASMLCGQVAEHAAHQRVCAGCGMLQPLKDRRTRRLQTLFGTVTAISDGDPALPALVRSARGGSVEHILDWLHLSMRVHHGEQVMHGLCALEPPSLAPLDQTQIDVERLRHLLWNGRHHKACEALGRIASWAKDAALPNEPVAEAKVRRLAARCAELRSTIENNEGALIDYGQRCRAGKPISTSRAEGTVNQLVSARMNKRRQMRWSPRGAHRVLQVRAAVPDGRLGHQAIQLAA